MSAPLIEWPAPSMVISEVILGSAAIRVIAALRVIVSAPTPAGQPPVAVSVLAAVMASDRLQVALTVILAAWIYAWVKSGGILELLV